MAYRVRNELHVISEVLRIREFQERHVEPIVGGDARLIYGRGEGEVPKGLR